MAACSGLWAGPETDAGPDHLHGGIQFPGGFLDVVQAPADDILAACDFLVFFVALVFMMVSFVTGSDPFAWNVLPRRHARRCRALPVFFIRRCPVFLTDRV